MIQAWSWRSTGFLQCFDTVGLVIWPVKIIPEMTYYVWSGTLNPTHSLTVVSSNFGFVGFTVLEIQRFSYCEIWARNCLFMPTFRGFGGHIFPQMTSSIAFTPKKQFLVWKHIVCATKRENQSSGSTWECAKEKRTGQDRTVKKVTKALYFAYLGRSPHWTDLHQNLHSSCHPGCNHVCKLLNWKFWG